MTERYKRHRERAMVFAIAETPDNILQMADRELVSAFNRSDMGEWQSDPLFFLQLRVEIIRRGLHKISSGVAVYPGI